MPSTLSDCELMKLVHRDDADAFAVLYDRYADALLHYCAARLLNKSITEEIVQEVFVSLWTNRHSVSIHYSLKGYLFQACRYKMFSLVRAQKVRIDYARRIESSAERLVNVTEEQIDYMSLRDALQIAIRTLPERSQKIFRLSRMEYLSVHHIAKIMKISHRTVENHLSRALKMLRRSSLLTKGQ